MASTYASSSIYFKDERRLEFDSTTTLWILREEESILSLIPTDKALKPSLEIKLVPKKVIKTIVSTDIV